MDLVEDARAPDGFPYRAGVNFLPMKKGQSPGPKDRNTLALLLNKV